MTNTEAKAKKIAIFGGSFDPPHFGHLDIVKNLERAFDEVIVVPSYISPFKSGASDPALRLKICKRMFTSDRTSVLAREINRKEISYSVDTAAYLAKKNKGDKLFWVIGSEELLRLRDWHDIDRLKTLVVFFVVPRPGYIPDVGTLAALKKRKIKLKFAKFCGMDISSTEIKLDIAFGKSNKYMPTFVREYAAKYGLFDPYGKYVAALKKYELTHARMEHTYRTALRGAELAKMYGADVTTVVTACVLHDIAKSVDPKKYADKVDLSAYPEPCRHAPIGAYIAKKEFGISDEIAHAIAVHSTASADMSVLDEIVWLADKTESGRRYKSLEYQRYICSLDRTLAMYSTIVEIDKLEDNERCEFSKAAIKRYNKLLGGDVILPEMPDSSKPIEIYGRTMLPMVRAGGELRSVTSRELASVPERGGAPVPVPEKEKEKDKKKSDKHGKKKHKGEPTALDIAESVAAELDLHKAFDIDIVDLDGKTIIADYFVIASATSSTAVRSLYGYVEDRLTKEYGLDPLRRDVDREWVALDYGSIIVHIFTEKVREFYNIERLWADGKNITRYGA